MSCCLSRWRSDGVTSLLRATGPGGGRGHVPGDAGSPCASGTFVVTSAGGGGPLGHGFRLIEGPQGVGGGRAAEDAARPGPGAGFPVEEDEDSAAFTRHPPPTAPDWPRGQARPRWELAVSASSPAEALELRASSSCRSLTCGQRGRFGRMHGAGGRLGGTAERWKVGSGHLARPLVTQLFSPQGGWEQPQQQAEAKPMEMRTGAAPQREPARGQGPSSARL